MIYLLILLISSFLDYKFDTYMAYKCLAIFIVIPLLFLITLFNHDYNEKQLEDRRVVNIIETNKGFNSPLRVYIEFIDNNDFNEIKVDKDSIKYTYNQNLEYPILKTKVIQTKKYSKILFLHFNYYTYELIQKMDSYNN